MSDHHAGFPALDALFAASRHSPSSPPVARDSRPDQAARDEFAVDSIAGVAPEAADLLTRLMRRFPAAASKPRVLQVLSGDRARCGSAAAGSIACAAAGLLGRTLLLNTYPGAPRRVEAGALHGPVPDAFVPGLYHRRIAAARKGSMALFGPDGPSIHGGAALSFRFIVIDSLYPALSAVALALAPSCAGSVLVVKAGITTHSAVREAAAAIEAAGGKVFGTILTVTEKPSLPATEI